ncbi:MAG TPA: PBP1A family penicillin-binding protein [Actinomycetota bacterium]|nr:PBP1A family penicillin-binding protein [Actinomycetota bacterium]
MTTPSPGPSAQRSRRASVRLDRILAGVVVLGALASACHLPDLAHERAKAPALQQTSFVYASDGTLITSLHAAEDRVIVPSKKIPEVLRDAVIAIEDKRFYDHHGVDLKALMRAAYVDATSGRIVEGGSTITQQYVKQTYVGDERTLSRKIEEAYLAWQLEDKLSKDQILTKYLNTVYFGNGAYGIQAAAQTYFDRPATDLTLSQSALLAGLIRAPNDYDPVSHPNIATRRRNQVLSSMLNLGMIDASQVTHASDRPVHVHTAQPAAQHYVAPYFVDYVKQWFLSNPRFGKTVQERYDLLFKGGLRITTTIDPKLQQQAETAVHSILLYPSDPYAAMTVVDPRTGFIKAMVGGRDYWSEKDRFARINLATGGTTGRQAGSSFKPFALVAALEHGISPSQSFDGSSVSVPLGDGTVWTPGNAEGGSYGYLSMESATIYSVNIAYVNIEKAIGGGDIYLGARRVVDTAKRMGIRCCTRTTSPRTPLQGVPSAVLGTNEVNTLEMASAYGTLADGGLHVMPTPVASVTTAEGKVLYQAQAQPEPVVNPSVVTLADQILQKVVLYGTGTAANIGRPQIGKTGTAQNYSDAWFVGAVPQLVAAVWVGFPQGQVSMCCGRTRISPVYGGTWPAQIWRAFMVNATAHLPAKRFPTSDIRYVTISIDITQGCLANEYTPPQDIHTEQYVVGTEPHLRVCREPSSYQTLAVPSVVGLRQDQAVAALQNAGFTVKLRYDPSSTQRNGFVIGQDPSGGERAQQTSTVTITISGTDRTTTGVPDVVGMTLDRATTALANAGFEVSVTKDRQCNRADTGCDYRKGVVWSQSPAAGNDATTGTTVVVTVNP